jgi:hypothetical protein
MRDRVAIAVGALLVVVGLNAKVVRAELAIAHAEVVFVPASFSGSLAYVERDGNAIDGAIYGAASADGVEAVRVRYQLDDRRVAVWIGEAVGIATRPEIDLVIHTASGVSVANQAYADRFVGGVAWGDRVRYAELRVEPDGEATVVGFRDADLRPVGPSRLGF